MFNIFGRLTFSRVTFNHISQGYKVPNGKKTLSKVNVPVLLESDLEEHFIKGTGPGGSCVNKTSNCVHLLHKPTGLVVKVHDSRELNQNRKIARERLTTKLDNLINGENSVERQKEKILNKKTKNKQHKQRKLQEMKNNWKEAIDEYDLGKESISAKEN